MVVAEVERCYGGPEEGGWWYDVCTVVYVEYGKKMSEATADGRARELKDGRFADSGRPLWSVNYRGGTYRAWVLEPGERQWRETPRYSPRYS